MVKKMFLRIEMQMQKKGITKAELARKLNIDEELLMKKLNGQIAFTLDEAWKLKKVIGAEESMKELFNFFD